MLSRRTGAAVALTAALCLVAGAGFPEDLPTPEQAGRPTPEQGGRPTPEQDAPPRSDEVAPGGVGLEPAFGEASRPNIVVIMADDMREDELTYMPRTRALIERQGVRFTSSFSPHPMCCPARASFLTGKYTHNHHVWANRGPHGGFPAFDDSDTLAVRLSQTGYETVFVGKYLNGYGKSPTPDGSPEATYIPPGWSDWRGAIDAPAGWEHPFAGGTYRYLDTTLNINGALRGNKGWYQTRMLGAESEDVIGRYARSPRPFFLWASYVAPHVGTPLEEDDPLPIRRSNGFVGRLLTPAVPGDVRGLFDETITRSPGDAGEADVSDKPYAIARLPPADLAERRAMAEVARQRAESLWVLDEEVERTVEALRRTSELDNTVVVFTSDNGYLLGEHRVRQGKLLPYEPSLRVPLMVRGPGVPVGRTRPEPVLSVDFAPSFLGLAGARPQPAMDGTSFLPVPTGQPAGVRGWTRAVLTETGPRRSKATTPDGTLPAGANRLRFTQGVRTGRYLYLEHATGERELYDMRKDPDQLDNRIENLSARNVTGQLAALLARLRDCVGRGCRAQTPGTLHR